MTIDLGLLILQVVVGLVMAGHGAQKLFGWFGGYGLAGTAGWLGSLGLYPARFWALVAGLAEFGGGLLTAFGLLHPIGPLAIIAVHLMAIALVHASKGLWLSNGGGEYNLVLIAVAAVLGLAGPGRYALDRWLGIALPQPETFWIGLVVVLAGLIAGLALRRSERGEQAMPQAGSAAR
ncbi:MAG TPA: DoxX family protein [Roseiflexaceae bacterium]|nr:DoxX family protein [Roseiflexaceae bacterium]